MIARIFGRTRRHNRHFYLKDDLIQCRGVTRYYFHRCSNWGKPNDGKTYWCHIHQVQKVSDLIRQESRE